MSYSQSQTLSPNHLMRLLSPFLSHTYLLCRYECLPSSAYYHTIQIVCYTDYVSVLYDLWWSAAVLCYSVLFVVNWRYFLKKIYSQITNSQFRCTLFLSTFHSQSTKLKLTFFLSSTLTLSATIQVSEYISIFV